MKHGFFQPGDAPDERYRILRDDDFSLVVEARQFVEHLWLQAGPYLDSGLPVAARRAFQQRFWELYLTHTLLENGIRLARRDERRFRTKGPDLQTADKTTWIEAVLASPGAGDDAVEEPVPGEAGWVPSDPIKLRLLNAISNKLLQYEEHRRAGIIQTSERYIVALGASAIRLARLEATIPRLVGSVLPFGSEQAHIDRESGQVVGQSFAYQPAVRKRRGAPVATTLFQEARSAPISALLYAWADEVNRPRVPGQGFVTLHNPLAANPLPRGSFPFGREYWFEDGQLHWLDHQA